HLQILQVLDRTHTSLAILRIRIGMHGSISIHSEPLDRPTDIRVALAPRRVKSDDPWLAIKSSWRQAHDDAARYATDLACFDAILCNERGELTEGSKTNLFVEREGVLLTPPTSVGLLPGILRASLLADARAATAILTAEELANSDAIYLGNSARGLMRARLVRA
ncbi:MAG TPA: aminotransferase class IV, partial [Candidatus Dormibacteraeota bacterium]|nr:aminotransferase class IV [Candidatus Dormibacteraeota bacterium]